MDKENKNQIIFIGGGEVFKDTESFYQFLKEREYNPYQSRKRWRDWIAWALSDSWETFSPQMPNGWMADYEAWKIWFDKLVPYLNDQKLVLVGHSLGGIFLAKYLSENSFPKKIDQLHLVAAVFDDEGLTGGETCGNFLFDPDNLKNIPPKVEKIFIYHSKDDELVKFNHGERFHNALTGSELITFADRGHFLQPAFPELLQNILK